MPNALSQSMTAGQSVGTSIRTTLSFGQQVEIPPTPEHVPEKFKTVWGSLPPCCRSFYLNPGSGCCAGMPEPNAAMMAVHKANGTTPPAAETPACTQPSHGSLWAVGDWFRYLGRGFGQDMKRIFLGRKED
ncbi:MAG: hypothetical protein AB7P76_09925 [Candidatus Melainabacteria bacterium]